MRVILLFLFLSTGLWGAANNLVQAAERGDLKRCTELIEQGVDGGSLHEAFRRAVENEQIPCVKLFIGHNVLLYGKEGFFKPLEVAARMGNIPLLEALISDHWINLSYGGSEEGIQAILCGHVEVVQWLMERGGSPTKRLLDTPLIHYAAMEGDNEIIRLLVGTYGSNVNAKKEYTNYTPLHYAARCGHLNTMNLLIDLGADASIKSWERLTAKEMYDEYVPPGSTIKPAKR